MLSDCLALQLPKIKKKLNTTQLIANWSYNFAYVNAGKTRKKKVTFRLTMMGNLPRPARPAAYRRFKGDSGRLAGRHHRSDVRRGRPWRCTGTASGRRRGHVHTGVQADVVATLKRLYRPPRGRDNGVERLGDEWWWSISVSYGKTFHFFF